MIRAKLLFFFEASTVLMGVGVPGVPGVAVGDGVNGETEGGVVGGSTLLLTA